MVASVRCVLMKKAGFEMQWMGSWKGEGPKNRGI